LLKSSVLEGRKSSAFKYQKKLSRLLFDDFFHIKKKPTLEQWCNKGKISIPPSQTVTNSISKLTRLTYLSNQNPNLARPFAGAFKCPKTWMFV
jgi:hypothetical protein